MMTERLHTQQCIGSGSGLASTMVSTDLKPLIGTMAAVICIYYPSVEMKVCPKTCVQSNTTQCN